LLRKAGINIIISSQDAAQSAIGYSFSFSFRANADEDETKHRHNLDRGSIFPECVYGGVAKRGPEWQEGVFRVACRILMSQMPQSQAKRALINCSIL